MGNYGPDQETESDGGLQRTMIPYLQCTTLVFLSFSLSLSLSRSPNILFLTHALKVSLAQERRWPFRFSFAHLRKKNWRSAVQINIYCTGSSSCCSRYINANNLFSSSFLSPELLKLLSHVRNNNNNNNPSDPHS